MRITAVSIWFSETVRQVGGEWRSPSNQNERVYITAAADHSADRPASSRISTTLLKVLQFSQDYFTQVAQLLDKPEDNCGLLRYQ